MVSHARTYEAGSGGGGHARSCLRARDGERDEMRGSRGGGGGGRRIG